MGATAKTILPGDEFEGLTGFDAKPMKAAINAVKAAKGKEVPLKSAKITDLEARRDWMKSYSDALASLVKVAAGAAGTLSQLGKKAGSEDEKSKFDLASTRAKDIAASAGADYKSLQ